MDSVPSGAAFAPGDGHAGLDGTGVRLFKDPVDGPDGLAAVGGDGLLAVLELIELFQDGHGNDNVVFLEVQYC